MIAVVELASLYLEAAVVVIEKDAEDFDILEVFVAVTTRLYVVLAVRPVITAGLQGLLLRTAAVVLFVTTKLTPVPRPPAQPISADVSSI